MGQAPPARYRHCKFPRNDQGNQTKANRSRTSYGSENMDRFGVPFLFAFYRIASCRLFRLH
jgi:hypothetical protein